MAVLVTTVEKTFDAHECPRRFILFAVGALGVSCVMTQLALMRELLGAFSGNEMVLGVTLGLWLLLMGIGAGLGRTSDKLRNPLAVLVVTQILIAVLPLLQVFFLRALRNVVFIRGAEVGVNETAVSAAILLLPYCVAAGYALTLACSLLAREDGASGVGRVYVADSIGSIAGGILFSFVLIRFLDHIALLVVPALLNLLAAGAVGFCCGKKLLPVISLVLAVGVSAMAPLANLDGISTGLLFQKQHIVARANSPYGRLVVTESDGQFDFIENGVPIVSTRDDQHVEETVHYAMAQRPDARQVLLVSGGISGTAKEILKYGVSEVDYVELDPLILEFGRKYLPENLADRLRSTAEGGQPDPGHQHRWPPVRQTDRRKIRRRHRGRARSFHRAAQPVLHRGISWLKSSGCFPGTGCCPFRSAIMKITSARNWRACWPRPAARCSHRSKTCW